MRLDDTKVPKGRPAPRMANGKPDFSGYWKGTTQTSPGGNIGKGRYLLRTVAPQLAGELV